MSTVPDSAPPRPGQPPDGVAHIRYAPGSSNAHRYPACYVVLEGVAFAAEMAKTGPGNNYDVHTADDCPGGDPHGTQPLDLGL